MSTLNWKYMFIILKAAGKLYISFDTKTYFFRWRVTHSRGAHCRILSWCPTWSQVAGFLLMFYASLGMFLKSFYIQLKGNQQSIIDTTSLEPRPLSFIVITWKSWKYMLKGNFVVNSNILIDEILLIIYMFFQGKFIISVIRI